MRSEKREERKIAPPPSLLQQRLFIQPSGGRTTENAVTRQHPSYHSFSINRARERKIVKRRKIKRRTGRANAMCVHVYMCAHTRARVYMKRMKRANSCVYVCMCVGVSVRVILEILY